MIDEEVNDDDVSVNEVDDSGVNEDDVEPPCVDKVASGKPKKQERDVIDELEKKVLNDGSGRRMQDLRKGDLTVAQVKGLTRIQCQAFLRGQPLVLKSSGTAKEKRQRIIDY